MKDVMNVVVYTRWIMLDQLKMIIMAMVTKNLKQWPTLSSQSIGIDERSTFNLLIWPCIVNKVGERSISALSTFLLTVLHFFIFMLSASRFVDND